MTLKCVALAQIPHPSCPFGFLKASRPARHVLTQLIMFLLSVKNVDPLSIFSIFVMDPDHTPIYSIYINSLPYDPQFC